jgi:multidrug efflux pump subunit AcrA (membrane-fusion protein)
MIKAVVLLGATLLSPTSLCCGQDTAVTKEIRLPITLQGDQRTELRARVEGYVAEVHVDIGDRVTADQVLVTLDAPELEADVRRRQQIVLQSQANLGVAEGAVRTAEARLRQAASARDEQAAMKQLRSRELDRYRMLVQGGAVQREKLDEAEFAVMAVDAAVAKIEADVEAARADIEAAKSEVAFARSGIEVSKAELAHAVAQDQLRQIKSSFDALVTDRTVDPGQLVSPGSMMGAPLLVVEKVDVLRGVMTIPADEAVLVKVGDSVTLTGFGDAPAQSPDGQTPIVSRLSHSLDETTRTMRIEIDLKNPFDAKNQRYAFLSGQYGSATIHLNQQR